MSCRSGRVSWLRRSSNATKPPPNGSSSANRTVRSRTASARSPARAAVSPARRASSSRSPEVVATISSTLSRASSAPASSSAALAETRWPISTMPRWKAMKVRIRASSVGWASIRLAGNADIRWARAASTPSIAPSSRSSIVSTSRTGASALTRLSSAAEATRLDRSEALLARRISEKAAASTRRASSKPRNAPARPSAPARLRSAKKIMIFAVNPSRRIAAIASSSAVLSQMRTNTRLTNGNMSQGIQQLSRLRKCRSAHPIRLSRPRRSPACSATRRAASSVPPT
ncbi:hypothetical protein BTHI11S_00447 [Bosea thiooxidans]